MLRRTFPLATLIAAVLLTACSSPRASQPPAAGPVTRTVQDAKGPVQVPADPQRVVVLDGYALDALTAVGVTPVGIPSMDEVGDYLTPPPGATEIGTAYPVAVEKVAALEPDLVLVATEVADLDIDLAALQRLAPVVIAPHDDSGDWRQASLVYADAVGRRPQMEQVLKDVDERAGDLRERLTAREVGPVTVARADSDQLRLYGRTYFSGSILDLLGVRRPASQNLLEERPIEVSYEQVQAADADHVFLYQLSGEDAARQRDVLTRNPLWQRLRAVRNGRVVEVADHWYGSGPLAAGKVLDDVEKALL